MSTKKEIIEICDFISRCDYQVLYKEIDKLIWMNTDNLKLNSFKCTSKLKLQCTKTFRWTTFGNPKLKGQPLFLDIKKGFLILIFFFSKCLQKFLTVFEILRKEYFRGRTCNSSTRLFIEKMKIASCWKPGSKQVFFNNAFQNVCRFQDIWSQRFYVFAPKIPFM